MVLQRQPMKNITIALPEIMVDGLVRLQEEGLVPSRSEGIRLAVRSFLRNEYRVIDLLGYKIQPVEDAPRCSN
jgi:Arc/MetJ-type ribon-helix-helix transcriptional regulator